VIDESAIGGPIRDRFICTRNRETPAPKGLSGTNVGRIAFNPGEPREFAGADGRHGGTSKAGRGSDSRLPSEAEQKHECAEGATRKRLRSTTLGEPSTRVERRATGPSARRTRAQTNATAGELSA